jgi:hypothetical protein
MTVGIHPLPTPDDIRIDGDTAHVEHLVVSDPEAVRLLGTASPEDRREVLDRIITVGARGMMTMGVGIDVDTIDTRVRAVVSSATDEAQQTISDIIERGRTSMQAQFDPEQRSSIMARALDDFTSWRAEFLATLDPGVEGSAATVLVDRLLALVGPDGALERRLAEALDVDSDESAFARLTASMEAGFEELRRDLARSQGADAARADEAERGTAHGLDFEDVVEANLRSWAAARTGTIVERTSTATGDLDVNARVGDFVVTTADGRRIVVEAKRHARITLGGADGILAELDRATANRRADASICIAGRDAYPTEVGRFNVYGDRVLVVDEGDGIMTAVALQWALTSASARSGRGAELDAAAVADRIERIRVAAESISGARRSVTSIRGSLDKLHELLGGLRVDLLDQVSDLDRLLSVPESRGPGDTRP